MKIDNTIIDRVLDNAATKEEARAVNEWFTTEEGIHYLSSRIEQESFAMTENEIDRWVDHSIPETKMKARFLTQISPEVSKTSIYHRWMIAAVLIPFLFLIGSIAFLADRVGLFSTTEFAELSTPCGEQLHVILQDGTKIQLNSDSRLRYPVKFGMFNRKVELWGEAYFSVSKERSRPFIVDLKSINIQVTGTKFNVKAYPAENDINVTLDEGGVTLKDSLSKEYALLPGETANYNRKSGLCHIMKLEDPAISTAWRSNNLNFYLAPLSEIIKVIERQYNVRFIVNDSSLLNNRFTLSTNKVDIQQVLQEIETVSEITFKQIDESNFEILVNE